MSTVVNSADILGIFDQLGWKQNQQDLLQAVFNATIPAAVIVAYLNALIQTPGGMNDQAITGVTPAQGSAITTFLKTHGLVGT